MMVYLFLFACFSVLFSLCPKRFAVVSELPVAYGAKQPTKQNCPGSIAVHPERSYIWHPIIEDFGEVFSKSCEQLWSKQKKLKKKERNRKIGSKNRLAAAHRCRHPASCTRRWAGTQTLPGVSARVTSPNCDSFICRVFRLQYR